MVSGQHGPSNERQACLLLVPMRSTMSCEDSNLAMVKSDRPVPSLSAWYRADALHTADSDACKDCRRRKRSCSKARPASLLV